MSPSDFTITPAAEKFMRRIVRFSGLPGAGFRMRVAAGGCAGYSTEFGAEAQPRDGDAVVALGDGLRLFLPAESRLLLCGATLDCVDTPIQSGLTVHGPATASCGCAGAGTATAPSTASVPLDALLRR